MTPQPSWRAADDTRRAIASVRLFRAIADLRWDILVLKTALRLHRRYDPNQPRIPAGSAEGGQWTSGGATSPREMTWRRGTPLSQATPAQLAVIAVLQARADALVARVRLRDPTWPSPKSLTATVEGQIEHWRDVAARAEARETELIRYGVNGPGRFAVESFPAPVDRALNRPERERLQFLGDRDGCHTCGVRHPGGIFERWLADHQRNTALNPPGQPQDIFPQCAACSAAQGGYVRGIQRRGGF